VIGAEQRHHPGGAQDRSMSDPWWTAPMARPLDVLSEDSIQADPPHRVTGRDQQGLGGNANAAVRANEMPAVVTTVPRSRRARAIRFNIVGILLEPPCGR